MKPRSKERASSSKRETAARGLPEFAVSLFILLLMWLFAEFIFLPLSAESFTKDLSGRVTSVVATAFILAIGYLLPQTAREGDVVVKLLSDVLAKGRYEKMDQARMQRVFESLGRALLSAFLGIIVSSLLYWVHPVFGGMALLSTIVITFIFILEGANQASEKILQKVRR
jgi:uncharacterized membrane protein